MTEAEELREARVLLQEAEEVFRNFYGRVSPAAGSLWERIRTLLGRVK